MHGILVARTASDPLDLEADPDNHPNRIHVLPSVSCTCACTWRRCGSSHPSIETQKVMLDNSKPDLVVGIDLGQTCTGIASDPRLLSPSQLTSSPLHRRVLCQSLHRRRVNQLHPKVARPSSSQREQSTNDPGIPTWPKSTLFMGLHCRVRSRAEPQVRRHERLVQDAPRSGELRAPATTRS